MATSEKVPVTISEGTVVVYHGKNGLTADTIVNIDGGFVDVGGIDEARWLRRDDIVAIGVYGDEDGIEVILDDD